MSVSLTGKDTIQIDGRVLADLADGDAVKLDFPEDIANLKVSKNGNVIYALNETGKICDVELRVLLGSADDLYLNSRLQEMKGDFSSFILMSGIFNKRVGDGFGNITSAVWQNSGGIFKKQVAAKSSAEGDTEQSVAVYTLRFKNDSRSNQ